MALRRSAILALVGVLGSASAWADQLVIPGAPPQQVTFTDFSDNKLRYQTKSGDRNERELERVSAISVDGETALNEAEDLYSKDQKDKSVDGYMKAIRGTSKPWLKVFAARRLLDATGNSNRFDAKLVAYLAMLVANPEEALAHRPQLPEKGNKYLDSAVTEIETTLKQPNLAGPQQLALYNFLIEVHRQRGDDNAIAATLERIDKLSGTLGDQPEVKDQLAGLKVNQALQALEKKQYKEAAKLIEDNRENIIDPRLQAEALYVLAASKNATVDKADKNAMQDTAVAFMRVVAVGSDVDGKPKVLPSLVATAAILEQINDKKGAIALLEQIAAEFPKDPAAEKAKKDLDRLKGA
jgi:TolA-binding protein